MDLNFFTIFCVCVGVATVFYFIVYVVVPLMCLFIFMLTHYADLKAENGCYGVKLDKADPTFHYYSIETKEMKLYDIFWEMYELHKKAYSKILEQIKYGETHDNRDN